MTTHEKENEDKAAQDEKAAAKHATHAHARHGKADKEEPKEIQLTLMRAVNEHDTVFLVGNTTGVGPHAGTVDVDGEIVHYKMASTDSLHGCVRGEEGEGGSAHDVGAIVKFLPPEETPEEAKLRELDEKEHRTKLNVNRIESEEDARKRDEHARAGNAPLIAKRVKEGQNP